MVGRDKTTQEGDPLASDTSATRGRLGDLSRFAAVVPALATEAVLARTRSLGKAGTSEQAAAPGIAIAVPAAPGPAAERPGDEPMPESAAPPTEAPGAADAAAAFHAFNDAFYAEAAGFGLHKLDRTSRRLTSFWTSAELIEMVEDRAEGAGDAAARRMVNALLRGFILRYGRVWTRHNRFNDDLMWAVIAALRAHRLTGDPRYRDIAQENFDLTFARAWSGEIGGGLWWTTACREKNACVNAPAAIAASLLYEALHDRAYLATSQRLYEWVREYLYEAAIGRVNDHVLRAAGGRDAGPAGGLGAGAVDRRAFTYNQGTFIGAADLLHRITGEPAYREEALRALAFAKREMAPGGVLRSEGERGDGGGFKGIFARYAVPFARRCGIAGYEAWFRQNAHAAWDRRDERGLMGQDWAAAGGGGRKGGGPTACRPAPGRGQASSRGPAAWDASSAVVLLLALDAGRR